MRHAKVLTVAAGLALATLPTSPALATGDQPHALPAYVTEWTLPAVQSGNATADLGPAAPNSPINARVFLTGRDPRGLARYAAAVSDPHSPTYRHYLDQVTVQAQFGPSPQQLAHVIGWLNRTGLHITNVTPHNIAVSGTAVQAQRAFGVAWHSFQVPGSATSQQAPASTDTLTVPAEVGDAVLTVAPVQTGLPGDTPTRAGAAAPAQPKPKTVSAEPKPKTEPAPACSQYYGQHLATNLPPAYGQTAPSPICGYTPQQMRSAYGVPDQLTGKGQTIAVIHPFRETTAAADLATYGARHGQPLRPGQFTEILPPGLDASCTGTTMGPDIMANEETGDLEAVHAMAPDANLVYVGATCDNGEGTVQSLDAMATITDHHLASIVSNSWTTGVEGSPGMAAAYDQVLEQGAAEGIGFYFAAGDLGGSGDFPALDGKPHLIYPASDPWATAVGGTSIAIGPDRNYEWEVGWGNRATGLAADGKSWDNPPGDFGLGSGGGTSTQFTQPTYQRGIVPNRLSHAGNRPIPMRVIPDIAADADLFTGLLSGETFRRPGQPPRFEETPGGGTSLSTPLIAGMEADVQQATGHAVGFANPTIYSRFGTADYHDIVPHPAGLNGIPALVSDNAKFTGHSPALVTLDQDAGLATEPGFDNITGVGTPTARFFTH